MARKKKTPEVQAEETPVTEEVSAPEEEAPEESNLTAPELAEDTIGDLLASDDEEDFLGGEPEAPEETPAEASTEEAPTEDEPSEEVKAGEEEEEKAAPEEQTPEEEPVPEEPAEPPLTLEQQQENRAKWRSDTEEALAVGQYALTEDQVVELDEDPAKFIPKFAARVYLDAVENATAAVVQLLPQVLGQYQQNTTKADGARESFFKTWDKLDPDKHSDVLTSIGQAYRAANPNATPDEFIRDVGAATMVALKIPFEEAPAEPAAPAAPAHKPLGTGAAQSPASPQDKNQFTQIAEEQLDEQF
jgi:hypothetical protein